MTNLPKQTVDSFLPLRPAVFHLLLGLSHGVGHGYGLKLAAEERTGGVVRLGPGTLYESLQRMEQRSLIEEAPTPPSEVNQRSDRRYYRITKLGRSVLRAELRQMEAALAEARRASLLDSQPAM